MMQKSGAPRLTCAPARLTPVMLAEVVKLFRPRIVDLHNYVPTCNTGQKRSNWNVLNRQGSKRGFPPCLPCWAHSSHPKAGLHGWPPPRGQVLRLCPCVGFPDTLSSST